MSDERQPDPMSAPTADGAAAYPQHRWGWSVAVLLAAPAVAALPSLGRLSLGEAMLAPLLIPPMLIASSSWLPLLGLMLACGVLFGVGLVSRRTRPTTIIGGAMLALFSAGAQVILSAGYA